MSAQTKIAWSNTATYSSSNFETNPSYALTEYKKQIAETTQTVSFYEVSFTAGNCLYVGNTDATSIRVIISDGTATDTISATTILTADTVYGSTLSVSDTFSLTVGDGFSMYVVNGDVVYDSGDTAITENKTFEFTAQTTAQATVLLTGATYLGLLFTGTLTEYGEPEYPINDQQIDFGFKKRTINGTTLYTENFISNDISFNLFSTLAEYKSFRDAQRLNRNNVLCVLSSDTGSDEYYTRYGFLDIVNGTEMRGQYYNTQIKLEGV